MNVMAHRVPPYDKARAFGKFTRSLADETFKHHDLRPMRDHDAIMDLWVVMPGFMDGYMEEARE